MEQVGPFNCKVCSVLAGRGLVYRQTLPKVVTASKKPTQICCVLNAVPTVTSDDDSTESPKLAVHLFCTVRWGNYHEPHD